MASVLVVEPWYGGSHRVWLDGWCAQSRHDIDTITLPAQFWRWRMRGAAADLAELVERHVEGHGRPDLLVASSLCDVAGFVGLARRSLRALPVAVYMHENQLLYPTAPNQRSDDALGLVNWTSLLAADAIWWNSCFHRDALLAAIPDLLARQPELPLHDGLGRVGARSMVLAPGVRLDDLIAADRGEARRVPLVLWNQRWDHDKNPHAVFSALAALAEEGLEFELVLAGENPGHGAELDQVIDRLNDRVRHRGFLPASEYRQMLVECDVVVSAADHEFFGIAIVEALAAGAVPVLPDRLSFPELVGEWGPAALYPDGELRRRLREVLTDLPAARARVQGLRASMHRYDVRVTARAHDDTVDALLASAA